MLLKLGAKVNNYFQLLRDDGVKNTKSRQRSLVAEKYRSLLRFFVQ